MRRSIAISLLCELWDQYAEFRRGQVAFYLSQYHCRHTWITEALNHLSVADVSYLARVSPNVLYRHYAGRSRRILIPEF